MRTSIQMSEDGFGTNGEKRVSISGPGALLALLVARGEFSQLGVLNLNRGMEGLVRERPVFSVAPEYEPGSIRARTRRVRNT